MGADDALAVLAAAAERERVTRAALEGAVRAAVAAGAGWGEIGRAAGLTRQGARQRWGRPARSATGPAVPVPAAGPTTTTTVVAGTAVLAGPAPSEPIAGPGSTGSSTTPVVAGGPRRPGRRAPAARGSAGEDPAGERDGLERLPTLEVALERVGAPSRAAQRGDTEPAVTTRRAADYPISGRWLVLAGGQLVGLVEPATTPKRGWRYRLPVLGLSREVYPTRDAAANRTVERLHTYAANHPRGRSRRPRR